MTFVVKPQLKIISFKKTNIDFYFILVHTKLENRVYPFLHGGPLEIIPAVPYSAIRSLTVPYGPNFKNEH